MNVVRGYAILKAMGTAGIFCQVSAQGAALLASGVGGIHITHWRQDILEVQINHSWLNNSTLAGSVYFQNAIEAT